MKSYIFRNIVGVLAFVIGICAACLWLVEPVASNLQNTAVLGGYAKFQLLEAPPQFYYEVDSQPVPKPTKPVPINRHENFKGVVRTLKLLVAFKGKKGVQTFYISKVMYDEGEFAYAYWKQDASIIILSDLYTFDEPPPESFLDWLSDKGSFNLKTEVVPTGKYKSIGNWQVEKDWADKVLKWCKAGYELEFIIHRRKMK